MSRSTKWAKLLNPANHIYSRAQPDPFAPARPRGGVSAPPALRAEIRRRLLAGVVIRRDELTRNFGWNERAVREAVEFERGRIAGQREVLALLDQKMNEELTLMADLLRHGVAETS